MGETRIDSGLAGVLNSTSALFTLLIAQADRSVGPDNTVLVTFLIPPLALVLGMVVLDGAPDPSDIGGMMAIGAALWVSQRKSA